MDKLDGVLIDTDVLVVGAGAGGLMAALSAKRNGPPGTRVTLVDPLTGIANRRAFLEEVLELSKRQQTEGRSAAVLLADLDHFKSINDRFGHAVGDHVLQIFAAAASAKLGPYDLIGRLGGEEFAMVIYDAGHDKGLAIAERIRLSFEAAAVSNDIRMRSAIARPLSGPAS